MTLVIAHPWPATVAFFAIIGVCWVALYFHLVPGGGHHQAPRAARRTPSQALPGATEVHHEKPLSPQDEAKAAWIRSLTLPPGWVDPAVRRAFALKARIAVLAAITRHGAYAYTHAQDVYTHSPPDVPGREDGSEPSHPAGDIPVKRLATAAERAAVAEAFAPAWATLAQFAPTVEEQCPWLVHGQGYSDGTGTFPAFIDAGGA